MSSAKGTFTCPCGKVFQRYYSQLKNDGSRVYCSQRCKKLYHIGNFSVDQFRLDRENYQFQAPKPTLGDYSHLNLHRNALRPIKEKKYNHFYFQNGITNEEQAYIFGLLLTDGSITKVPGRSLSVRLLMKDQDIVEQVHRAFESKRPIEVVVNKYNRTYYQLRLTGIILPHDLDALGCSVRKTEIANYPLIPDELDRHFIRGVIDGDGSWSVRKRDNTCELKLFGHDHLLYGIYLKIKKHLGIDPASVEYPIDHNPTYKMKSFATMKYSSSKSDLIARFVYENATIYGQRKRNIVYETRSI